MRGAKETRPCAACGKQLTKLLSQAKGENWYCDKQCQRAHMPPPGSVSKTPNPYRGQKATRPCAVCSKPVTRYLTPSSISKPWTCSYECMGKQQRRRLLDDGRWTDGKKPRRGDTIPCSVCGTPFYRQPAYIKQGRHLCSRECNRIWQTKTPTEKTCRHCGAPISVKPSQAHRQFCSQRCAADHKIVRPTGRTHNGRPVVMNHQGYLTIYEPTHPAAPKNGRILEHRFVMEKVLGRYLLTDEHVDHIDQDKTNNDPSNLQIMSPTDHSRKTNADKERARAKLLAELAAYREKYGELPME